MVGRGGGTEGVEAKQASKQEASKRASGGSNVSEVSKIGGR